MSRPAVSEGLPVRRQVALSAYWFSLNFESASLLTIVIPAALDRLAFHAHTTTLAQLAVVGSLVAMVLPPMAGAISDRIHRRGGQRRSMLLWGTLVNVLGLLGMLSAGSVLSLAGGFLVAILGQNVAGAAYQAMMPDIVPKESWGLASGYMGVASLLGTIGGLAIAGIFPPAAVYCVMALVAVLGGSYSAGAARGEETLAPVPVVRAKVRDRRDFFLVFLARFFVMFGQTLLMTFILYFFQDVLHVQSPKGSTALIAGLAMLGAVLSSIVLGNFSDRSDRPGIVFLATIPMAIAAGGFGLYSNMHWIFLFAILYGVGYGAYLSVDWALALDAIPDLSNVARDLGIWGIASNLPAVLAPAAGGVLLARALTPAMGYRELFLVTGGVTLLGAIVVLFVRTARRASFADIGLRLGVSLLLFIYVRVAYRVRIEGRLPRDRGATLVVANHAHDLEGMVLPVCLQWQGRLSQPVYSAGSERLFEPGFLATRAPDFLRPVLAGVHLGKILSHLGVRPIENMPRSRPFVGLAYAVWLWHGNLQFRDVFTADTLLTLGIPGSARLRHAWRAGFLQAAQTVLPFTTLRAPYRAEVRADVRGRIEGQIDALADILDDGGTLYLTPEGRYTENGELSRLRESLVRLVPHAENVVLSALSYDPFNPGRLRLLVRLLEAGPGPDLRRKLVAARPVTVSQVVAAVLVKREGGITRDEVVQLAAELVRDLGGGVALAPEIREDPRPAVRKAIQCMLRRGILREAGGCLCVTEKRGDERFPGVTDMLSYQAAQFEETRLAGGRVPTSLA